MSTRRDAALALLGVPALVHGEKQEPIMPFSEATARIISYTLYAEARGEPFKGKMAVAAVIQTRSRLTNRSLSQTCLMSKQFSCWNDLMAVPDFYVSGEGIGPDDLQARSDCYGIAWVLMTSDREWEFLTHFYNPNKAAPAWAKEMRGTRTIGNHVFGFIN